MGIEQVTAWTCIAKRYNVAKSTFGRVWRVLQTVLEFGVGGDEDSAWCCVILMWSHTGNQWDTSWWKYVAYLEGVYGGGRGVYGCARQ